MSDIPQSVKKLFWDTNPDDVSFDDNYPYIIEKVLEYGGESDLSWLNATLPKEKIIDTLKTSKRISAKTGNFYALYYGIPLKELLCIRKPYTRKQDRF